MRYRVWDTDINRLFGTYDNEGEALSLVSTLVSRYGEGYAEDLAVGCEREDGSFTAPLSGAALLKRADDMAAGRTRAEAERGDVVASRGGSGAGLSGDGAPTPIAATARSFGPGRRRRGLNAPGRGSRRSPGT